MDAGIQRVDDGQRNDQNPDMSDREESLGRESQRFDAGDAARDSSQALGDLTARPVRARLNGVPCLVSVTQDNALSGQLAVAPVAGGKAHLPLKGRRATLELVADADTTGAFEEVEPIEITLAAANPRSGRFTARFLALSEEQSQLLNAVGA